MKTSAAGMVSAAILAVVVGVGFGIAQAGGYHSDGPVLSFEDQAALEQGDSSDVAQARGSVETGSLPEMGDADSSIPETEDISHRTGGKISTTVPARNETGRNGAQGMGSLMERAPHPCLPAETRPASR